MPGAIQQAVSLVSCGRQGLLAWRKVGWDGWLVSPKNPPVCLPRVGDYRHTLLYLTFQVDSGGSNSGSHAGVVSTSPPEPSEWAL